MILANWLTGCRNEADKLLRNWQPGRPRRRHRPCVPQAADVLEGRTLLSGLMPADDGSTDETDPAAEPATTAESDPASLPTHTLVDGELIPIEMPENPQWEAIEQLGGADAIVDMDEDGNALLTDGTVVQPDGTVIEPTQMPTIVEMFEEAYSTYLESLDDPITPPTVGHFDDMMMAIKESDGDYIFVPYNPPPEGNPATEYEFGPATTDAQGTTIPFETRDDDGNILDEGTLIFLPNGEFLGAEMTIVDGEVLETPEYWPTPDPIEFAPAPDEDVPDPPAPFKIVPRYPADDTGTATPDAAPDPWDVVPDSSPDTEDFDGVDVGP